MRERFDKLVTSVENTVMLTSYMTLIGIVGFETLRRMVTREQAAWGPEVALYAFVWLSWFAMSSNTRQGRHLAFTELRDRFPRPVRLGLEVIDCLIWLVLGLIIIYTSWGVVETNVRLGQVIFGTNIPLAIASLAVPFGWGFTMVRILQKLWEIVTTRSTFEVQETVEERLRL